MNEENFNWNSFKRSIIVSKDIETIYEYIATSKGITRWFIGDAIYTSKEGELRNENEFVQASDEYLWKWFHKDLELKGKILDANGKDFFKFTFGSAGTVSINLKNSGGRGYVELYQEVYPGSSYDQFAHINCYVCWSFFIINLKSVIENRIDLRESEAKIDSLANW